MHSCYYRYEVSRNHGDEMNVIEPPIIYTRDCNYALPYEGCKLIAIQNSDRYRRAREICVREVVSPEHYKTNHQRYADRGQKLVSFAAIIFNARLSSRLRYTEDFRNVQWQRKEKGKSDQGKFVTRVY